MDDLRHIDGGFGATREQAAELARFYRKQLCENILPWWLRYAMDADHGGICTCIRDDGTMVSRDKYVWSQVRALWTFSAAYNRIEPRPEWRAAAGDLFAFVSCYGRNEEGDWNFLLDRLGGTIEGPESIQTDAFAICGMVEYARMTGSDGAAMTALATYRRCLHKLRSQGGYRTKPYPLPAGTKAHRVSMQFSLAFSELGKLLNDSEMLAEAMTLTDDVLDHFRRPARQAIVEYLSVDNSELPSPVGTYMSPGHGIETAWFQIANLRDQRDASRIRKALEIMRWSCEKGWDVEYGGLLLGLDINGGVPYLPNSETKIWWPFTESICGLLMAYEVCRERWCLDWFIRIHNWAFAHFPDHQHGEWRQRLDRSGRPIGKVVALPVKDPFHLPRGLIYAVEALGRLASQPGAPSAGIRLSLPRLRSQSGRVPGWRSFGGPLQLTGPEGAARARRPPNA
jgi:N-acylglucosamine 2-epimerase